MGELKKMLTESKKLNIAIILLFIINIIGLLFGITYAILATLMPYHQEFLGLTPSQISNYNSRLMFFIGVLIRMSGLAGVIIAITNLFILNYSFRNKEKWSWKVFLITGLIYDIPMLIVTYTITGPVGGPFLIFCLVTALFIIAMGISYKEIFG